MLKAILGQIVSEKLFSTRYITEVKISNYLTSGNRKSTKRQLQVSRSDFENRFIATVSHKSLCFVMI